MNSTKRKMSGIVKLHWVKIIYRTALFLAAFVIYLYNRIAGTGKLFGGLEENKVVMAVVWLLFFVEMLFRFFPSKLESPGCQKHFARNFRCRTDQPIKLNTAKTTALAAFAWILLNGVIGVFYYTGIFDIGIMYLIAFAYSVCDVICILFFCPFQTWIMKNKCCTTCRIYNWDYAMMFTPLLIVGKPYGLSLFAVAFVLLVIWEVSVRLHPERFTEASNASLACANCTEKLCHHKTQLKSFLQKELQKGRFNLKGNKLFKDKAKNPEV